LIGIGWCLCSLILCLVVLLDCDNLMFGLGLFDAVGFICLV